MQQGSTLSYIGNNWILEQYTTKEDDWKTYKNTCRMCRQSLGSDAIHLVIIFLFDWEEQGCLNCVQYICAREGDAQWYWLEFA